MFLAFILAIIFQPSGQKYEKIFLTIITLLGILFILLNYIFIFSFPENIKIYPLFIIETHGGYSVISLDFGQIVAVVVIIYLLLYFLIKKKNRVKI
ncbi:hypothetical protein FFONT_1269 [Fervidicoccus fontis Kam940]|uniref:Uncharacterized protein n=1 Tax=Fervidicoccus fontis (strain DSM 19380 / JCM 18336 / VKM B-2539 / Kam940) TaxID=1163730 RepID=I0A2Q0_FERFK|nr:hypothetical protein FFONT_1269 [Fervidicoccus fontis Kam940]